MVLFIAAQKCTICHPQIPFYSTVFTQHTMKPNPTKVQALQDLPDTHQSERIAINFSPNSIIYSHSSLIPPRLPSLEHR